MVRVLSAVLFAVSLVGAPPLEAARHAIHTTLAEISFDPASKVAMIKLRAFADDFGTASARWNRSRGNRRAQSSDSVSFAYLSQTLSLERARGGFAPLEWCGVQRTDAVLWLCVRARLDGGLEGVRLTNRVLNDLFEDEINIVQVDVAGRRSSSIFTRKDLSRVLIAPGGR